MAGKAHFVRDNDHLHAFLPQSVQGAENFAGVFRIQSAGRFVQQQKSGIGGQGAGDGDALPLPAGKLRGVLVHILFQPQLFQQCKGAFLRGFRAIAVHMDERRDNVLERRHVPEQPPVLEDKAEFFPVLLQGGRSLWQGFPVHQNFPGRGGEQAAQEPEQRGLAAA